MVGEDPCIKKTPLGRKFLRLHGRYTLRINGGLHRNQSAIIVRLSIFWFLLLACCHAN